MSTMAWCTMCSMSAGWHSQRHSGCRRFFFSSLVCCCFYVFFFYYYYYFLLFYVDHFLFLLVLNASLSCLHSLYGLFFARLLFGAVIVDCFVAIGRHKENGHQWNTTNSDCFSAKAYREHEPTKNKIHSRARIWRRDREGEQERDKKEREREG